MEDFLIDYEGLGSINLAANFMNDFAKVLGNKSSSLMKRVLNRTLQSMRKVAVSETVSQYYVSASEVRKSISLDAQASEARLHVSSKRRGLEHFRMTTRKGKSRPVNYAAVRKNSGLKRLAATFFVNSAAFTRQGKSRLPIDRAVGPAVTQMIQKNELTLTNMLEAGRKTYSNVLNHELTRFMKMSAKS